MSSASVTGLAVLENVRQLEGKSFRFDAQFFVNETQTMVVGLRYFNAHNFKIEEFSTYMVCAYVSFFLDDSEDSEVTENKVAKPVEGVDLQSDNLSMEDYHLVGDAAWVRTPRFYTSCALHY